MANDHICLTTDATENPLDKKFAVLYEGYKPRLTKRANLEETINGGMDAQFGAIYDVRDYVIRVRYTENETEWGDLEDLRAFFVLNNPNGNPSNVITLCDHFDDEYQVWMVGDFQENILSVEVDNEEAWYNVRVLLQIIPTPVS